MLIMVEAGWWVYYDILSTFESDSFYNQKLKQRKFSQNIGTDLPHPPYFQEFLSHVWRLNGPEK